MRDLQAGREHPVGWIFGRIAYDFWLPRNALNNEAAADRLEEEIDRLIRTTLWNYGAQIPDGPAFTAIEWGRDMGGPGEGAEGNPT